MWYVSRTVKNKKAASWYFKKNIMWFFCIFFIQVQKRLKNEPGICCVAITDDASRIAFGITTCNKYSRLVD